MKVQDIREKSKDELQAEIVRLQREHFSLRMQRASGQLGQTHLFHQTPEWILVWLFRDFLAGHFHHIGAFERFSFDSRAQRQGPIDFESSSLIQTDNVFRSYSNRMIVL